jgi:hypothetical protein
MAMPPDAAWPGTPERRQRVSSSALEASEMAPASSLSPALKLQEQVSQHYSECQVFDFTRHYNSETRMRRNAFGMKQSMEDYPEPSKGGRKFSTPGQACRINFPPISYQRFMMKTLHIVYDAHTRSWSAEWLLLHPDPRQHRPDRASALTPKHGGKINENGRKQGEATISN